MKSVGTLQVASRQYGDHEHKLGEVTEQKPIQEMDIHCHAGFSIPHFSSCGKCIVWTSLLIFLVNYDPKSLSY